MSKPVYTNAQVVAQLDTGYHWSGSALTYGFATNTSFFPGGGEAAGFSAFNANQKAAATATLQLWDDLIKPDFTLTANAAAANIKFANTTTGIGYAHAYYPGTWEAAGSVWMNKSYNSGSNDLVNPQSGQWGYATYIHEIGHALGLDHPGDYNGGSPTYAADAKYTQDSEQYTVMSYFTADATGADWIASDGRDYSPQTPMLHDVLAIQAMYGAETTTRSGNTVYGYGATAGNSVFDFNLNPHPIICIYDAGGVDTLNLSNSNYACSINLNPGAFSNTDMMTKNISIAFGTWIENATGGKANDTIAGNALNNILNGMAGNDTLSGGAGNDSLYGGVGNDTLRGDAGNDRLDGGTGNDNLIGGIGDDIYVVDAVGDDVTEAASAGTDAVHTALASYVLDTNVENLVYTGTATFAGTGNELANTITGGANKDVLAGKGGNDILNGGAGVDTLYGDGGNDTLNGGAGADYMYAGSGNDIYIVDDARDTIWENLNDGTDTVRTALGSFTLGANFENLVFTGTGAFKGTGNALNNALTGGAGNDTLYGLAGNDSLVGGAGADTLIGGAGKDALSGGLGADVFRFNDVSESTRSAFDIISDFTRAQGDRIDLRAIDANTKIAGDQAFSFIAAGAFTGVAGQLSYQNQYLLGDINGDRIADFDIFFVGVQSLQVAEMFL
ncbi:M10 family metallopeptidase C-terminal domain-containing protein [Hyphomicrobium sp.]|uniref:M10 family metallopeptidase C-terminal domain-containing protein n=1 Tax=Hyphomicrobium sp. TaxID=82 RepID=UPI003F6EAB04